MAPPITVSGPRTDDSERNVGKNTIVISMTRHDAGFLKDIPRHYGRTNRTAGRTGQLCRELPDGTDGRFPAVHPRVRSTRRGGIRPSGEPHGHGFCRQRTVPQ